MQQKRIKEPTPHPGKERVETVDLLPFSHVRIILSDALQSQLFHKVDLIRLLQMFVLDGVENNNNNLSKHFFYYFIPKKVQK